MEQQRLLEQQMEQQRLQDQQLEQQRLYEQQQRDMLLQQQREMERLRLQQQQQEQFGLGQQVEYLRQQSTRDRQTLNEYEQKFAQMQQQLAQMNLQAQNSNTQTAAVQKLTEEIDQWKQKYEALAKLYAQLRKEHLDLLQKFKTMKDANLKVSEDARKRIEQVQNEMKVKGNELTEVLVERNRLKGDADRIRLQYEGDLSRMRQELEQSKQALNDMSLTRGSEVQSLVARFTVEQTKLEDLLNAKQKEVNLLTTQLGDVISAMEKAKMVLLSNSRSKKRRELFYKLVWTKLWKS
jgi:hypothetical protein